MNTEHVNDTQIQQYLFDRSNCDVEVLAHIDTCEHCMSIVDEYQDISQTVKELPEPVLEFNLATSILENLPETKSNKRYVLNKNAFILLSFGVLAILLHVVKVDLIHWSEIENLPVYFTLSIALFIGVLSTLEIISTFKGKMTV
ncbi:hypothetical protein [uncultured Tenacibaculum sp.]|uniref:hypothetical protein n=1 Tax=uncultured Tenacibaculum sp. TaxID=174713 RepID=UPI0026178079|nr:hypothetical protein [uncultured Tenacibaculum sp.]